MIVDKFNRQLDLMQIAASNGCHYSCSGCAYSGKPVINSQLMPTEDILRFVGVMAQLGLHRIRLIGGEPLTRPDIMDLVTGLGAIRDLSVSLSTNGKLLESMAPRLHTAGLARIYVSLPTLDPGLFMKITGHDDLPVILSGIETFREKREIPLTIRMTLMAGINCHEIETVTQWAISRDIDICLVEKNIPGARQNITEEQILTRLKTLYNLTQLHGQAASIDPWKIEGNTATVKIITADNKNNCDKCNRLWLSPAGILALCNGLGSKVDIKEFMEEDPSDSELVQLAAKIALNKPLRGSCSGGRAETPSPESIPSVA